MTIITGYIYGERNRMSLPLPGVRYRVSSKSGALASDEDVTNNEGYFAIGIEDDSWFSDTVLEITSAPAGFAIESIPVSELRDGLTIYLRPKTLNIVAVASVIAALLLLQQKKKKVGKLSMSDIGPIAMIGVGVLGFTFFKQLMEKLGIWDSKDNKELDEAAIDPNSAWSPTFWQNKPANEAWSYAITQSVANGYANEIYNAFGAFNDCEECAKAVIKRLRTKANLSFLAWCFSNVYGQDLLSFLRGGYWPQDRLSDADVNELNNYIKNLPNY